MKHPSEELLVLYHYGEAPDRREVEQHLGACEPCRANYQALRRLLAVVDTMPVPERAENYGAEVWRQVRPQIARAAESDRGSFWRLFRWPRWAVAGALALLVSAAFFAGRTWPRLPSKNGPIVTQSSQPLSAGARERVLLTEIGDHLERSQLALIELLNSKTNGAVDLSAEQVLARELAAVNRLFRRAAADGGEPGVASVLEELERVLVEVANGPAKLSADEFAALRERIDSDGLLFKVKVIGAQVRIRERDSTRELAAHRS
jgi:hypothetical protein